MLDGGGGVIAYGCYTHPNDTFREYATYIISARCEADCHSFVSAYRLDQPWDNIERDVRLALARAHSEVA